MKELDEKLFKKGFIILRENFNFEISAAYLSLIFETLKNRISDEEFNTATNRYLTEVTMEIWNKKYGFNGKPAIADWLEFFTGNKKLTLDEQAKIQVERIIDEAKYPENVIFDNEFTNATVATYGGLKKMNYDSFDNYNPSPKKREWLKKELVEIWLTCNMDNKRRSKPFIINSSHKNIEFIGNKDVCKNMIDRENLLEYKQPKFIENLSKSLKCNNLTDIFPINLNI